MFDAEAAPGDHQPSSEWADIGNQHADNAAHPTLSAQSEQQRPSTSSRSRRDVPPPGSSHAQSAHGQAGPMPSSDTGAVSAAQDAAAAQPNRRPPSRQSHSPHAGARPTASPPEPTASAAPVVRAPERPMTAKKAPPKAPEIAQPQAHRSRVRPPQAPALPRPGSRSAARVYVDDLGDSDDNVDIVQETFVRADSSGQGRGALLSDMYKAKEAAEQLANRGSIADSELHVEGGIDLGRTQRKKRASMAQADLGQLRNAVESLVQGVTPLARAMEHLQVCPCTLAARALLQCVFDSFMPRLKHHCSSVCCSLHSSVLVSLQGTSAMMQHVLHVAAGGQGEHAEGAAGMAQRGSHLAEEAASGSAAITSSERAAGSHDVGRGHRKKAGFDQVAEAASARE